MKKITKKRNDEIVKMVTHMSQEKRNGVQLYSYSFILAAVSKKFFLAEKTVENILKKWRNK